MPVDFGSNNLVVQWGVKVNGIDVSNSMNEYITGIEISGNAGGKADSARLSFADIGGEIKMPPKGSPVEITIEGRLKFKGYTDVPETVISRGGGQTLEVACSGYDKRGKAKQAINLHKDDCTLQEFLDAAAKKAGVKSVKVDPEFGLIKRDYWSTRGRNFLQLGQAYADEFGGTFKLRGDQAVLAKRGDGTAPGGGSTPTIYVTRGGNLIEARMKPDEGRQRYSKARVRYYDRKKAKHVVKDVEIDDDPDRADVLDHHGEERADADQAENLAKGRKTKSERESGSGSCTILLDVTVEVEGTAIFQGIKPGIDAPYRIEAWTIKVSRDGAETGLTVKQPQGEAGKDTRKPSTTSKK